MLISDYKKFIFIHIYKNAGSSIKYALEPFALSSTQRLINKFVFILLRRDKFFNTQPYGQHIRSKDLINEIGLAKFESYFSFAIVRNPWAWQVSLYTYILKSHKHQLHDFVKKFENFDQYLLWRCTEAALFQKDFIYSEEGTLLVDFVGRFETLQNDFNTVCSRIGINTVLPIKNVSNTIPYQEFYNEKTRELVRRTFQPDIDLFNYDF